MTTPPDPVPQAIEHPHPLADWGSRFVGFLIDYAPILILNALTYNTRLVSFVVWVATVAYWGYLGHIEGISGQTPGKAMMGLRLVDRDGQLLGSGTGIGRKYSHVVDVLVCGLGFLLPLVDSRRQTIADKLFETYVVRGVEKKPFSIDLWTVPSNS